jgi:hypothetical protein
MARFSQARTPKTPAAHLREDEQEVTDASLLTPNTRRATAGRIAATSQDDNSLLSIKSPSKGNMGLDQSREEIHAAINATSEELRARNVYLPPQSSGKLRRPSTSRSLNPPHRNPTDRRAVTKAPQQRRLGPNEQARPDTYALDVSPERGTILPKKQIEGAQTISPVRKQKKASKHVSSSPARSSVQALYAKEQQRVDEQLALEQQQPASPETTSSPRRSRRQQEKAAEGEDGDHMNTQDAHNRNWFPPRLEQQIVEEPMKDGAEGEVQEEAEVDAQEPEEQESEKPPETSRKRGRPKKHSSVREQRNITAAEKQQNAPPRRSTWVSNAAQVASSDAAATPIHTSRDSRHIEEEDSNDSQGQSLFIPGPDDENGEGPYVDDAGNNEGDEDDEGDDEVDSARSGDQNRRPPAHVQIARATPAELFGGTDSDPFEGQETPRTRSSQKGKRKATASQTANTSKKRARTQRFQDGDEQPNSSQESAQEGVEGEEDEDEEGDLTTAGSDFYGQWPLFRRVFKAVKDIGVRTINGERQPQRTFRKSHAAVITILNVCQDAIDKLAQPEDAASEFKEIAERTDLLYTADEENEVDFDDGKLSKNVYAHLFPELVRLLRAAIESYEAQDHDTATDGPLTHGHLKHVVALIKLMIDLREGMVMGKFPNPPPELVLVQPVRSIVGDLKKVHRALRITLLRQEEARETRRQARRDEEEQRLLEQRFAEEERQREHANELRRKWKALHDLRVWVEGGIVPKRKREHLTLPKPEPEYDGEGRQFERLEVFAPRIGPSPAMVDEVRAQGPWSYLELDALERGLRKYVSPGDNLQVFVKIIREHCSPGGALNRFNVTEIVTTAADFKEFQMKQQRQLHGHAEEWLTMIPIWTKDHPLGKENDEEPAVVGEGAELDGA